MLPVAPVTFSITTDCPSVEVIDSPTARMQRSDGPPTAVGTTMRIGFSGYVAAAAANEHMLASAAMHTTAIDRVLISAGASKRVLSEQLDDALRADRRFGDLHAERRQGVLHRAHDRRDRRN